jgi:hypothetical protein
VQNGGNNNEALGEAIAMDKSSKQDVLGGLLLLLIGAGTVWEARGLSIGHLTEMGAGYFPIVLGCILAFLGVVLLAGGLMSRTGSEDGAKFIKPDWRGCSAIVGGLLAFLIAGWRFGLAPATFSCVLIAAMGDRDTTLKGALMLATAMTVFTVGLFAYGLQIQFPVWRW